MAKAVKKKEKKFIRDLSRIGACYSGLRAARRYSTAQAAWKACRNPSWLLWVIEQAQMEAELKPLVDRWLLQLFRSELHGFSSLHMNYKNGEYCDLLSQMYLRGYPITAVDIRECVPRVPRMSEERIAAIERKLQEANGT